MLKSNQKDIKELLESDDEFPPDYHEIPDTPAYQNDMRFEPVKFGWIDTNFSKYYSKRNETKTRLTALHSCLNESFVHNKTQYLRPGEKALIYNGVLSESDIVCLKYVESLTSDATLLWFIHFLIQKDMHTNFTFLRTCLVDSMSINNDQSPLTCDSEIKKFNFEIIYNK